MGSSCWASPRLIVCRRHPDHHACHPERSEGSAVGEGSAVLTSNSPMSVLVVGSVALDSVETPFGKADNVLGGSGTFFSASASHLAPVQLVGVIGNDYPIDELKRALGSRPVDLSGLEQADGASFRWRGRYRHDLNLAETLETHLGV